MRTLLPSAMAYALFLTTSINTMATTHPPHVVQYIDTYDEIAIQEMHRSGIPASVTLAQGIHESSWGLGELSVNSNNHFGIKCKSVWSGPTYYIKDDDYQNGVLMKSCFRVYNSVEESYIDHTNFLVEGDRYKILFTYGKTDYKNWAKGLKSCGYATDPNYAKKLIRTIEKYGLDKYDLEVPTINEIVEAPTFRISAPTPKMEVPAPSPEIKRTNETPQYIRIPSNIVTTLIHPEVMEVNEAEIPQAVSIENYFRNENNNEDTNIVYDIEEAVEPEILEEETVETINVVEEEPRKILSSPRYQLPPTRVQSSIPPVTTQAPHIEAIPEEPKKLSVTNTENTNLQLLKGKTRVKKTLRR